MGTADRSPEAAGRGAYGGCYTPTMVTVAVEEVATRLRALRSPFAQRVRRWDVRVGRDHAGEPAVFVHPVLDDEGAAAALGAEQDAWYELHAEIRQLVARIAGVEPFTYIRLRLLSEADTATSA